MAESQISESPMAESQISKSPMAESQASISDPHQHRDTHPQTATISDP